MSLPAKSAASKTTKGIPTGVLALIVAVIVFETHTGQDVDLESYLPVLIPLGMGGLAKHGIDVAAGRRRGGAPAMSVPVDRGYEAAGAPMVRTEAPPPAPPPAAGSVDSTALHNIVQKAVSSALKQQGARRK